MKKWSRLTAFMLAFAIMLSNASGALALVEVDFDTLNTWIQNVKTANGLGGVVQLIRGGEVVYVPEKFVPSDWPLYTVVREVPLDSYAAEEAPNLNVVLDQYGKVNLAAPAEGKWQVYLNAADTWVNVSGENGSAFALTFAKVQSLFVENNSAQLRCVMGDRVTQTVNVQLAYDTATLPAAAEEPELKMASAPMQYAVAAAAEGDETDNGLCVVQVHYLMPDDSIAANPWKADVNPKINSSLKPTITLPVVLGYSPTLETVMDGVTLDAAAGKLVLDLTVTADVTITVRYQPAEVTFKVRHYKQNLKDDGYSLAETTTHTGITDSKVAEAAEAQNITLHKTYEGFYNLLYDDTVEIAADGSTYVDIYYDRNYYLMNFELNGGDGVEPVYARFEASITIQDPVRAGYSFVGWMEKANAEATVALPKTMPAHNSTYYAKWSAGASKYTVQFWFEKANSDDVNDPANYAMVHSVIVDSDVTSGDRVDSDSMSDDVLKTIALDEAYSHFTRYTGIVEDEGSSNALQRYYTVEGDGTTFVNVYYKRNLYTIRFYYAAQREGQENIRVNTKTPDEYKIDNCSWTDQRTTGLPEFKSDFKARLGNVGSFGSETIRSGNYNHTVYYYDITARYNSEISTYWPNDVIDYTADDNGENDTYGNNRDWQGNVQGLIQNSWVIHEDVGLHPEGASTTPSFKGTYPRLDDNIIATDSDDTYLGVKNGKNVVNYFIAFWRTLQNTFTYFIYVEPLEGQTGDSRTYNGETYILRETMKATSGSSYGGQNEPAITGFDYVGRANYNNRADNYDTNNITDATAHVYFFYERQKFDLHYVNPGIEADNRTIENIPFETPMAQYGNYKPANAPNTHSVFAGWYTTPTYVKGTLYDFASETMPTNDVTLYAKWEPIGRKVEFYLDEQKLEAGEQLATHPAREDIPHGTKLTDVADPQNGDYTFISWFYRDENGEEKAFDFANMPITKDMKVYAKWSADKLMTYTVYFRLEGTETNIAAPITGSAPALSSKTFEAKVGEQLYTGYQEDYFPTTPSHTLVIDIDDPSKNIYVFEYVKVTNVPYMVYYVTENPKTTDQIVGDPIELNEKTYYRLKPDKNVASNDKAIAIEQFEPVSGYVPDAFQKTLILQVDEKGNPIEEKNRIIFVYTQDEKHAYYQVTHYIENIDANGNSIWEEYSAPTQIMGDINERYTEDPIAITGFTYQKTEYVVNGKVLDADQITTEGAVLTEDGLAINLYYTRNKYPYAFHFYEVGNTVPLVPSVEGEEYFGFKVAEESEEIPGYTCLNPGEQEITIEVDENASKGNMHIFWYQQNEVTLRYEVVGPAGSGVLDVYLEPLGAATGVATGSTPTANDGFRFEGWFLDAECKQPVPEEWVDTNNKIKPQKPENSEIWETAIYYAKFGYDKSSMTITKAGDDVDQNDTFVFTVSGTGAEGVQVTIKGTGSVTINGLTVGETYTVTEVGYSFRYTPVNKTQIIESLSATASDNTLTFTNNLTNEQWLDATHSVDNTFEHLTSEEAGE